MAKSKIKLWETNASMDTLLWLLDNIKNSPELKYIKDTWQAQKMAEVNADNNIWPARENVVRELNKYQRTSPSWVDKLVASSSLSKAVNEYNKMLEKYWKNTSWWPKNDEWKFYRQDYARYQDNPEMSQYEYSTKWDKWNNILNWQAYEKKEFKFKTSSWVDLLNQIKDLNKQYNKLEELQKTVWPKWNKLREQWKWDTPEAKKYLDKRAEYDTKKISIINTIRNAEDAYRDLVNNENKNDK